MTSLREDGSIYMKPIERNHNVDITKRFVTHVSHCYGFGGIDLGIQRVFGKNVITIAACEIEAFAIQNGLAKSEAGLLDGSIPFHTDIKSFPFRKFRGLVDIYSAGFPCQGFSCAGARKADEDPRHLFPYIKAGLTEMQPEWVFLENVDGIVSAKIKGDGWSDPAGTPILLHVLRELERVGYIPEAGVFSASEAGAPHQRKRVFILGRRKEGRKQNGLPVLSVFDGQCWGCPVWEGGKMADTNDFGHSGESESGVTGEATQFGVTGEGEGNVADPVFAGPDRPEEDRTLSSDRRDEAQQDRVSSTPEIDVDGNGDSGRHQGEEVGNAASGRYPLREHEHGIQDTPICKESVSPTGIAGGELADAGSHGCDGRSLQDGIEERKIREFSQSRGGEPGSLRSEVEGRRGDDGDLEHSNILLTTELQSSSGSQGSGKTSSQGTIIPSDTSSGRPSSRRQELAEDGEELEYSEHDGLPANEVSRSPIKTGNGDQEGQNQPGNIKGAGRPCSLRDLWPSRPGESQALWEPPRVTGGKTVISDAPDAGQLREEESEDEGENSGSGRGFDTTDLHRSDGEAEAGQENGKEDELSTPAEGGESVENADHGSVGNGRPHGRSNRQGRKSTKGRSSGLQQERKTDGDRPESASGDIGKVICGGCGFKNSVKWGRIKCLVCGKELADPINDGRVEDGQGG